MCSSGKESRRSGICRSFDAVSGSSSRGRKGKALPCGLHRSAREEAGPDRQTERRGEDALLGWTLGRERERGGACCARWAEVLPELDVGPSEEKVKRRKAGLQRVEKERGREKGLGLLGLKQREGGVLSLYFFSIFLFLFQSHFPII